jgi:sterol desaturase/sphingolipid hydroxylase (fatty acid hydroxylase superfamily)
MHSLKKLTPLGLKIRFILDTHQYFLHRLFHQNKFLYKHVHSHHHRLYVTYAFGALYNHPVEGFLLDSVGATLAFSVSGMSPRMGLLFFTFSTLKTGKPRAFVRQSEFRNICLTLCLKNSG